MSQLAREISEIPEAAARLLDGAPESVKDVAGHLRALSPSVMATIARGSSDHVATGLSYGLGMLSGIVPASYPPSLASLYDQGPRMTGQVALAISQSGQSRDILAAAQALHRAGAALVVLTNRTDSPLARSGGHVIDVRAGPELAVAATKSFVNSWLAGAMLLADWFDDQELGEGLRAMPDALARVSARGNGGLEDAFAVGDRLMVLGRGPSLGVAQEVALKAMELCGMTALAYSTAEVRHGPMQILKNGFPLIDFTRGEAMEGTATVRLADPYQIHPLLDPLLDLVPIYAALESAARSRGLDPDAPDRLRKETVTL